MLNYISCSPRAIRSQCNMLHVIAPLSKVMHRSSQPFIFLSVKYSPCLFNLKCLIIAYPFEYRNLEVVTVWRQTECRGGGILGLRVQLCPVVGYH